MNLGELDTTAMGNVARYLTAMAHARPEQTAIIDQRRIKGLAPSRCTFAELEHDVNALARGLYDWGIRPGQRLALLTPPSRQFITLVFALLKVGAVQILIDPGMGKRHLLRCLAEAEPTGFVGIPAVQWVRRLFRRRFPQAKWNLTVGQRGIGGPTYDQLFSRGAALSDELPVTQPDDPAAVIFTTGSTGPPKGVLYRHGNFAAQVRLIRDQYGIAPGEIDVPCFPLFGLFNAAMGVTTVLPLMDFSRPARCQSIELIEGALNPHHATQSFASPAVWDRLGRWCAETGMRINTVQRALSAGAPVRADVLRRTLAALPAGATMHTPYGATEALPIATLDAATILNETQARTEQGAGVCVGAPFAQVEWRVIRVVDGPIPDIAVTTTLPTAEIGELIVRGPMVTTEYVTRREVNPLAKITDPRGGIWHRMGDAGYLDEQGRFWFCGRVAHRVLCKERNYESVCVEGIADTHPQVRRTALVGVGPRGQQTPVLIVEPLATRRTWLGLRLPKVAIREQIASELRNLLAAFPASRGIERVLFHPSFPVDIRHNAKIFRERLAEWAARQLVSCRE